MEGRNHTGVTLTTLALPDASRARAWEEQWQGAEGGAGFRIVPGYELGDATHVAIREIRGDDVAAQQAGDSVSYTKIADYGPLAPGRTSGVVLVFTDCEVPEEEDTYNEWYSGHLHHTVENVDFYAATRYVSNDPERSPAKYLAIYETQSRDPARVQQDGVDWWVKGGYEGPAAMALRNEVPCERVD